MKDAAKEEDASKSPDQKRSKTSFTPKPKGPTEEKKDPDEGDDSEPPKKKTTSANIKAQGFFI